MALAAENVLNSPQRRWDCIRESSNTKGVIVKSAELNGIPDYKHAHLHFTLISKKTREDAQNLLESKKKNEESNGS